MTPRNGILAGGNWIIDHVKIIDTWPAQDALANMHLSGTAEARLATSSAQPVGCLGPLSIVLVRRALQARPCASGPSGQMEGAAVAGRIEAVWLRLGMGGTRKSLDV